MSLQKIKSAFETKLNTLTPTLYKQVTKMYHSHQQREHLTNKLTFFGVRM